MDIKELYQEIWENAESKFLYKGIYLDDLVEHIDEELEEVREQIRKDFIDELDTPSEETENEFVDIIFMTLSTMAFLGIDADKAIKRKLEIIKQR